MSIEPKQNGGNGSLNFNDKNKKFKNLIIPAGLALYNSEHIHSNCYDMNIHNEPVHNSLYDRLVELASYNDDINAEYSEQDMKKSDKYESDEVISDEVKKANNNKNEENIKLIKPVLSNTTNKLSFDIIHPASLIPKSYIGSEKVDTRIKLKNTKKNKNKLNKKQTRRHK
jgi:hypothetical protein